MSAGGTPLFELREVSFGYEEIVAIDACSLVVERGTRVALLVANGWASTLLLLLDALQPPSSGVIFFDGKDSRRRRFDERVNHDFRRRVFVFQNPEVQLFNPTVRDEIAFGRSSSAGRRSGSATRFSWSSGCSSAPSSNARRSGCRWGTRSGWRSLRC